MTKKTILLVLIALLLPSIALTQNTKEEQPISKSDIRDKVQEKIHKEPSLEQEVMETSLKRLDLNAKQHKAMKNIEAQYLKQRDAIENSSNSKDKEREIRILNKKTGKKLSKVLTKEQQKKIKKIKSQKKKERKKRKKRHSPK